jgi:hypothetical protein
MRGLPMFNVKIHKQAHIFDPWGHLGPKRRKLLDKSWSGLFKHKILPVLPVEALRKHYHDWNGRPTKELYSMIGMMVLQQMHDMTDEQAVEQFCFNIQWHYALNITSPEDAASYVSHKSLWSMRDKLSTDEIYNEIFATTLKLLEKTFKVDFEKQRMDSVHIKSNMRHLGRIGLLARTIKTFLNNLKRQHRSLFDKLGDELTNRYMSKKEESLFAMVKPSDSGRTLDQLAKDIFYLTQRFSSVSIVHDMNSFKHLTRLFKEQCVIEEKEDSSDSIAVARPNKEVPSDSLQNPSDPDAGYSSHKGQGYQVQVVETYSRSEDEKQLSLITHVAVESANQHDANALIPAIEDLNNCDMVPDELLADSLYGSEANCKQALDEYGVVVVAPAMPGNQKYLFLADFSLDDQGRITSCPKGIVPKHVKRTKRGFSAAFPSATCLKCEDFDQCSVCIGKKACYYRYQEKDICLARRRQYENSDTFKDKYRYRAGVEATMSEYDRRTGVKNLRVRGMKAVRFAAIMKAIGLNIFRASRYQNRNTRPIVPLCSIVSTMLSTCSHVKEQITRQKQIVVAFCVTRLPIYWNRLDIRF